MKDEYDGGEYEMKVGVSVSHLTCRLGKKESSRRQQDTNLGKHVSYTPWVDLVDYTPRSDAVIGYKEELYI